MFITGHPEFKFKKSEFAGLYKSNEEFRNIVDTLTRQLLRSSIQKSDKFETTGPEIEPEVIDQLIASDAVEQEQNNAENE